MDAKQLRRLFRRFRDAHDYEALTELFDATAPRLLALASHLVREADQAEDLVQATFLVAIERAGAWDSRRELYPWLAGILVHQAQRWNQRARLSVGPEELAGRLHEREGEPDPALTADRLELSAALRTAIDELPETYRHVLRPYFEEGRAPREIAVESGLAPGTVRVRIHRGLDLLRRVLPTGFALGAGAFVAPTRGLAAVRAAVVSDAKVAVGGAGAAVMAGSGAGVAAGAVTGLVAAHAVPLLVATLAIATGSTWFVSSHYPGEASVTPLASSGPAPEAPPPIEHGEDGSTEEAPPRQQHEDRVEPVSAPTGLDRNGDARSWVVQGPRDLAPPPGSIRIEGGRTQVGSTVEEIRGLLQADPELGGPFLRAFDAETPRWEADVDPFFLMTTEVTNEQYAAFVRATGHRPPILWGGEPIDAARLAHLVELGRLAQEARQRGERYERTAFDAEAWWDENWSGAEWKIPAGTELAPVTTVSFEDAEAYCRWAGMRLPTEEEYQRAVRGDATNAYPWGDDPATRQRAATNEIVGNKRAYDVASFPDGATPTGLHDLAGNVWEWTSSPYLPYLGFRQNTYPVERDGLPTDVSPAPTWDADQRVLVGGSFQNSAITARCTTRRPTDRGRRTNAVGFRAAASARGGFDAALEAWSRFERSPARALGGVFAPERVVGIDRWVTAPSQSIDPPHGYAVIERYEYVLFVPIDEVGDSQDVSLRATSLERPVPVGLLATSVDLSEPDLPAGTYLVSFRAAGPANEPALEELDSSRDHLLVFDSADASLVDAMPLDGATFTRGDGDGTAELLDRDGVDGPERWLRFRIELPSPVKKRVLPITLELRPAAGAAGPSWRR